MVQISVVTRSSSPGETMDPVVMTTTVLDWTGYPSDEDARQTHKDAPNPNDSDNDDDDGDLMKRKFSSPHGSLATQPQTHDEPFPLDEQDEPEEKGVEEEKQVEEEFPMDEKDKDDDDATDSHSLFFGEEEIEDWTQLEETIRKRTRQRHYETFPPLYQEQEPEPEPWNNPGSPPSLDNTSLVPYSSSYNRGAAAASAFSVWAPTYLSVDIVPLLPTTDLALDDTDRVEEEEDQPSLLLQGPCSSLEPEPFGTGTQPPTAQTGAESAPCSASTTTISLVPEDPSTSRPYFYYYDVSKDAAASSSLGAVPAARRSPLRTTNDRPHTPPPYEVVPATATATTTQSESSLRRGDDEPQPRLDRWHNNNDHDSAQNKERNPPQETQQQQQDCKQWEPARRQGQGQGQGQAQKPEQQPILRLLPPPPTWTHPHRKKQEEQPSPRKNHTRLLSKVQQYFAHEDDLWTHMVRQCVKKQTEWSILQHHHRQENNHNHPTPVTTHLNRRNHHRQQEQEHLNDDDDNHNNNTKHMLPGPEHMLPGPNCDNTDNRAVPDDPQTTPSSMVVLHRRTEPTFVEPLFQQAWQHSNTTQLPTNQWLSSVENNNNNNDESHPNKNTSTTKTKKKTTKPKDDHAPQRNVLPIAVTTRNNQHDLVCNTPDLSKKPTTTTKNIPQRKGGWSYWASSSSDASSTVCSEYSSTSTVCSETSSSSSSSSLLTVDSRASSHTDDAFSVLDQQGEDLDDGSVLSAFVGYDEPVPS